MWVCASRAGRVVVVLRRGYRYIWPVIGVFIFGGAGVGVGLGIALRVFFCIFYVRLFARCGELSFFSFLLQLSGRCGRPSFSSCSSRFLFPLEKENEGETCIICFRDFFAKQE